MLVGLETDPCCALRSAMAKAVQAFLEKLGSIPARRPASSEI